MVDQNRAEHLLDVDFVRILHVSEDRRLHVRAVVVATDSNSGASRLGLLDETSDGCLLSGVSNSADKGLHLGGVALLLGPAGEVTLEVLEEDGSDGLFDIETGVGLDQSNSIREQFSIFRSQYLSTHSAHLTHVDERAQDDCLNGLLL